MLVKQIPMCPSTIAHVYLGRFVVRTDPNNVCTNTPDVVKLLDNSLEISHAIVVRILVACRIDLINDALLPPRVILHSPVWHDVACLWSEVVEQSEGEGKRR